MCFRVIRANQHILIGFFRYERLNPIRMTPGLLNQVCYKGGKSGHQIKYLPYVPPCEQDHDHKNMNLRRPMSPHLTVYAPTLPAMTSIAQRATGCVLTFNALCLAWGSLFLSNGVETYVSMIQSLNLGMVTCLIVKLILAAPFAFHYWNGIRYVLWNSGRMLEMKQVYDTSKKAMVAAAITTALFAII
ncbi:unnamed protein product [Chrysodeixis includens]|uniref:Succinate dehydrogenase cytochrome b560 subunit, mitochondrial n=1 Tax=Chrysodeixis includens TaxID=689277 RepID=A0A9P0BNW4_CHRIL|nr:unnamed protein product [Chrysodeixis includens]